MTGTPVDSGDIVYDVSGDPYYVEDLQMMAKAVRYRQWLYDLLHPFLGTQILEVGGGIGNYTLMFVGNAESVVSIEPNAYCFDRLSEATKDDPKIQILKTDLEHLHFSLLDSKEFDTVVSINVLEHIADDMKAVEKMKSYLLPGGRLVLIVPAVPAAFGGIDRKVGHYRRYSRKMIRELFRKAGMESEIIRYFNFAGLLGWFWNAKIWPRNTQSERQIMIFDTYLVPLISRLEYVVPAPVGQSLLAVARK
ncbi:MAG: methyltransferase domain-containing protein [Bacteroidota bacterium]